MKLSPLSKYFLAIITISVIVLETGGCKKKKINTTPYKISYSGCSLVGSQIRFTYATAGSVSGSFYWTFGDGTSSNAVSPAHTYDNPGMYTATLVIDGNNSLAQSVVVDVDAVTGSQYTALMGGERLWNGKIDGYIREWQAFTTLEVTDTPWTVTIIDPGTVKFFDTRFLLDRIDTAGKVLYFFDCYERRLTYYYSVDSIVYAHHWESGKRHESFDVHSP